MLVRMSERDVADAGLGVVSLVRRRFRRRRNQVVVYRAIVKLRHQGFDSRMGVNDSDVTAEDYERIKGACIEALQNNLPQECRNLGLPVTSATFKRADSGSLELLFTTVWDVVQFAGDVAAFYDAVCLVGLLAEKLLERAAVGGSRKGMVAEVSCEPVFPSRNSFKGDTWFDMHVHGKGEVVLGGGCGNASAVRVAVACLGTAVVVLAVALAWLTWRVTSL